jgi:hypothetical protein
VRRQRRPRIVPLLAQLFRLCLGRAPRVLGGGGEGAGVVELGLEVEELADEGLSFFFGFGGVGGRG